MKKVLIIIPGLELGGTNSSLENIYIRLKDQVDFFVFSLSKTSKKSSRYRFCEVLLPYDKFLFLFDGIFRQMSFLEKCQAIFVKLLKRLFLKLRPKYIESIYKSRIKKIGTLEQYDAIIAFQEGYTTHFTSLIEHHNKIAWIHCNYNNVVPEDVSELDVYSRFRKIICVSNYTTDVFRKRYTSLADKTVTIYNLYDESRVEGYCVSSPFVPSDTLRLISVGRIDKVKRFSLIPSIADEITSQGVKIKWIIIGGVSNDVEEGKALQNAICGMKHYGVVEWIGPKDNPCKYMANSDLYVCLSESEACPMVFIESQLLGLPVLTTNFGSASEFVANAHNGIIVPMEDIVNTILTIGNNGTLLEGMRRNLQNFNYDNDKIINDILNLL